MLGYLELKLIAASNGKSGLAKQAAVELSLLGPRSKSDPRSERFTRLGIVFDPDADTRDVFENHLVTFLQENADGWSIGPAKRPHSWLARREKDRYRLFVHAVAWRAPTVVLDALPDWSNLERLLCGIAALAYPEEAKLVERWLGEMSAAARPHPWKAALHLWCALVEPKTNDRSAPARFLRQNKECEPHAKELLGRVSLLKELRPLLASP
jgi:hypothetical protein